MGIDRGASPANCHKDAVCIQTEKVYDICKDKECLEDLRVYFSSQDQAVIDRSTTIKFKKAEIIWVQTDVEPVPFNRGYYSVDINFYFRICLEVGCGIGRPDYIEGLATYTKKVILFGSEGSAYVFTSSYRMNSKDLPSPKTTNLPKAVVEVVEPIALNVKLVEGRGEIPHCACPNPCDDGSNDEPEIPETISGLFCGGIESSFDCRKRVYVTLGIFVIARLQRSIQLMVPCLDYCIPDKECVSTTDDDPCTLFERINFPFEEFYPPSSGGKGCGDC